MTASGGGVSASGDGDELTDLFEQLAASLNPDGSANWQGAIKSGDHWFVDHATDDNSNQIFHRLDGSGEEIDQMRFVGAAHVTSFAVIDDTVYATYDGEVVTFPYEPGGTITVKDTEPTGWHGYISVDPTQQFAVVRKGNHYRAYDLETRDPIGKEIVTPVGPRQGFSISGDSLYLLSGNANAPARVDSYSFATGEQTGSYDVTSASPGQHGEPEGGFGELMGVKTSVGEERRLNIFRLDTDTNTDIDSRTRTVDAHSQRAAGAPVLFEGRIVDRRTADMLREAERLANAEDPSIGHFRLTRGSEVTHGGPGVFDLTTEGFSASQKEIIGLAFRRVGFASWLRRANQGSWGEHWHGVAIGTDGLTPTAESQIESYCNGRNGLRDDAVDPDSRPDRIRTWEEYRRDRDLTEAARRQVSQLSERGHAGAPRLDDLDPAIACDPLTELFEQLAGSDLVGSEPTTSNALTGALNVLDPGASDSDGLTESFERPAGAGVISLNTDCDRLPVSFEAGPLVDPLNDGLGPVGEPHGGALPDPAAGHGPADAFDH